MTKQQARRFSQGPNSNDRRSLDAASIIINPVWNEEEGIFEGYLFGSTNGGVSFSPEVEYREREFDGSGRTAMVGNKIIESSNVTATAQVAELTTAIIQKVTKSDIYDFGNGRKELVPRHDIKPDDYIDSVLLVNWLPPTELQPDGDWYGILLENVLITSGLVIETEDNGDMTLDVEFTAHNDPADPQAHRKLPYRIITAESMNPVEGELPAIETVLEPEEPEEEEEGGDE